MTFRLCKQLTVTIAVAGLLSPINTFAEPPKLQRTVSQQPSKGDVPLRVIDVALTDNGDLQGAVANPNGTPQLGASVTLVRSGKLAASTKTDEHGLFRVAGLKSGLYELHTSSGICLCRIWTRKGAPPAAAPSILVVDGMSLERGQRPISELFYSDPIFMATIVAAAIAIPILIHKNRDDARAGS